MATYTRPDATYPAIAETGGRTPMSPADVSAGWSTSSQTRPPAATFNARDYLTSSGLKYLLRLGVAEYSPDESYQGLGTCVGSDGSFYWNLTPCQGIDPVNDSSGHWEKMPVRLRDAQSLAVPAGAPDQAVQYNRGGNFAGNSGFLFQESTQSLSVAGTVGAKYYAVANRFESFDSNLPNASAYIDFAPLSHTVRLYSKSAIANVGTIQLAGGTATVNNRQVAYLTCSEPNGVGSAQVAINGMLDVTNPATGGTALLKLYQPNQAAGTTSYLVVGASDTRRVLLGYDLENPANPVGILGLAGTPVFTQFNAGGDWIFPATVSAGNAVFNGFHIGSYPSTPAPGISTEGKHVVINPTTNGNVLLCRDSGTSGTSFCDATGTGNVVGFVDTTGNATFNGNLTAGTKTFRIPHPIDKSKDLIHGCLEGPEHAVFYRGEGECIDGVAEVVLPDYFEALTSPVDRTVMLDADGNDIEPELMLGATAVSDGKFNSLLQR